MVRNKQVLQRICAWNTVPAPGQASQIPSCRTGFSDEGGEPGACLITAQDPRLRLRLRPESLSCMVARRESAKYEDRPVLLPFPLFCSRPPRGRSSPRSRSAATARIQLSRLALPNSVPTLLHTPDSPETILVIHRPSLPRDTLFNIAQPPFFLYYYSNETSCLSFK